MGIFLTRNADIHHMVQKNWGKTDNYLVANKHNDCFKGLFKLLLSRLYYIFDGGRMFVLYFDNQGIHEKEISFTDNAPFLLIPWHEVRNFKVKDKRNKVYIDVDHLGKIYSYEIDFNGKLPQGNRERLMQLSEHNFYRGSL